MGSAKAVRLSMNKNVEDELAHEHFGDVEIEEPKCHNFVYEVLYHYNCGDCGNWWSYATTPNKKDNNLEWAMSGKYVYCPHCGSERQLKVKDDFEIS